MALIDKPFDATKRIIRSIFSGRPNLFTNVDVNRQFEAMTYYMSQSSKLIGSVGKINSSISGLLYNTQNKLVYDIRILPSNISVQGMTFTLPNTSIKGTSTVDFGTVAIYLVGRERLVTFEDDAEMSGVNSPDFQVPLASADNLVYEDISVVAFEYPLVNEENIEAKVGGDFKLISVIASIVPIADQANVLTPTLLLYSSHNVKDSITQLVGRDFSNSISIQEQLNNLVHYLIGQKKSPAKVNVGMTSFYSGPLTGVWDLVTGLGLSDGWESWAVMDGRNGTVNMQGRYFRGIQLDQPLNSAGIMGASFGADEYYVNTWNLPPHDHPMSKQGDNWYTMIANTSQLEKAVEYDSRYWSFHRDATVRAENKTGYTGGGQALQIVPRTVVALPVQKIK